MGSKKRSSDFVEEVENRVETNTEDVVAEPVKKRFKKDKKKDKVISDGEGAASAAVPNLVKPMERRKKRKSLDKERHHAALENEGEGKKREQADVGSRASEDMVAASSSSVLPEFHIGVFKGLASADDGLREAAVERLVMELQEVQKAYENLENKELADGAFKLEAEKDDGLNDCAPSVRYAVRRLIRGVSSSRECARQGFALGLTVLVGAIHSIKLDSLLKLIFDFLDVSSSTKGQELKDCILGRLFAFGAIARSGRLTEEWISNGNDANIKEFTRIVISLAAKKRYLQEPAVTVVLELVEKLPSEALLNHVLEAPGLREWFEGATDPGNPDALLLALKIQEKTYVVSTVFGNLLPNPFSASTFFSSEHLSSLVNCFKESTFCQPRVHSVWPVLVNILLPEIVSTAEDVVSASNSLKKHKKSRKSSSSQEESMKSIQCFCEVIIEGSLLLSSHDRKHLAFDILLLLLPRLPASFVPIVLSYKLVQCLIDILSTKDSWLYKVAQYFLKELCDWVGNDVRRVAVVLSLQKHSNGKFDLVTRTKTVKTLMAEFATESGCMLFIQNLTSMFLDEGQASEEPSDQSQTTDDNSEIGSIEDKDTAGLLGNSDSLKTWIVESLPSILRHLKLDLDAQFRVQKEILKFLSVQGLFSASLGTEVTSFELEEKFRWPRAATSTAICRSCIEQIQLLLASARKVEGLHSLSKGLEPGDLGSYFMRFLGTLRNIPSVSLFRVLSDGDEQAFNELQKMETRLSREELQKMETRLSREERNQGLSADALKVRALRYLLIQLLLQVLLQPGELSETVSELVICCKKAFTTSDLLDSGENEMDSDANPELMDVLVDTLLSMLPHSSAPMRSAIEQVFKYFCSDVTNDGLLRMLRVIKKDLKPARHQEADSEDDEDDDDDVLGIEEEEEIDEDETGETAESGEQTDDSDTIGGVEEGAKVRAEDSDDSDSGMDDDAMFRMDTYLAQIFKERKNHTGGETAQAQLVLFKLRILSLLEIYLHENPGTAQVLTVYSNLTRAFVNPHTIEISEQLAQRMWGVLQKKIFKAKKFPKGEDVQLPLLETLLEKSLKLASKPFKSKKSSSSLKKKESASWKRHKMITLLGQNSTFWLLKIIDARKFSEAELRRVFDIFKDVLTRYFQTKSSQIKSGFVKEVLRRWQWIGHHLFGFLLEKCGTAKAEYRRVEALDIVMEILKAMSASGADECNSNISKKILKSHITTLSHLVKDLVTNMPEKQSKRAEVRKFYNKVFLTVSSHDLTKSFLKGLDPEAQATCESKLGELFVNFKKVE